MVKYVRGDLLNCDADIICHQVNLQGVMGGGLAYQIAQKFPEVEQDYIDFEPKKLGRVCCSPTDKFTVANCFSQREDFTTDYFALLNCLNRVAIYMTNLDYKTIAIPYKYGCGIAKGEWEVVEDIFKTTFKEFDLIIYKKE